MKIKSMIIPVAAGMMLLTGCDDQIMEWGTPDGEGAVTASDIPLAVKEVLANYSDIKTYAEQYIPNVKVGVGASADMYADADDDTYSSLVNANYQVFTPGNAMKHDAMITNSGGFNFETLDALIDKMPSDLALYGHNFMWYQQTRQTYLKSLIAPTLVVESDSDIEGLIAGDSSDFNGGTTGGWGSWGSNKVSVTVVEGAGPDGSAAVELVNGGDDSAWNAQFAYTFDYYLDPNTEYTIRFKAKSSSSSGQLQFQYQNGSTYGSQGGYNTFSVGTEWTTYEYSFTPAYDDVNRIIFNFGAVGGTYYIDDIEFGTKVEDPMENVLAGDNSDFEGGTSGDWGSWGSGKASAEVLEGEGYDGSYGMAITSSTDGNMWDAQFAYTFDDYLDSSKSYIIQFYARSTSSAGQLQFQYQNGSTYGSQGAYNTFDVGTDWVLCEHEFTPAYDDVNRIIINFGAVGATYYVDNIKFGVAKEQSTESSTNAATRAATRASTSYYVLKTADEKREVLLGAMEDWIKGMAEHLAEKGVTPLGYDVINEPITDGTNLVRGVDDGAFGGSTTDDDGNTTYDSAPEETEEDGLTLNWNDNRFYWGYYVKDYAVQAFQMARKYLPAETKLFVNDYNLETSPGKLAALINFVNKIDSDNGSEIVDGIGTQMHISISTSDDTEENQAELDELKELVDTHFQTLAATGKLIRITELDVALGTSSPSSAQYEAQSDAYELIVRSYLDNIPEAQQSGFTAWSLSDNEDEHEYWLNGDKPNLFDADYKRKWAYKGFCDGIAGEDLGLQYGGDDYKAYYENDNVSSTVE